MEEGGISNMYIDNLMEKIVLHSEGHFQLIKFLCLKRKNFQSSLIYQKKMKKGHISLEYQFQKMSLYILIMAIVVGFGGVEWQTGAH